MSSNRLSTPQPSSYLMFALILLMTEPPYVSSYTNHTIIFRMAAFGPSPSGNTRSYGCCFVANWFKENDDENRLCKSYEEEQMKCCEYIPVFETIPKRFFHELAHNLR